MTKIKREFLKAPFPYFGGKSKVAKLVWQRLGPVQNYIEPFFGSGAVLLARPHVQGSETVNDKDHFLVNFWRAMQHDPEGVARFAKNIVAEADLQSRHYWLITKGAERIKAVGTDPHFYDVKVAGWWVWGVCCWIGGGWCFGDGPWQVVDDEWVKKTDVGGVPRRLPHLSTQGQGVHSQRNLDNWFNALADRLSKVRVCCGDWSRITGPSVTHGMGLTGVFLDPPYSNDADRSDGLYKHDDLSIAHNVMEWAIQEGSNPKMRIVIAGYSGEHDSPDGWARKSWRANGGYGNQSDDNQNRYKETLWFSPHCLKGNGFFSGR